MKTQLAILAMSIIFLYSCNQQYYIPNAQNVPLFTQKNEAALNFSAGGSTNLRSSNINVAYSVTNNIAIQANYMKFGSGTKDSFNNWCTGNYNDFAAGYYQVLDKNTIIQIFGGYGFSTQHHQYGTTNYNDGTSYLKYHKYFIQPTFGYTTPYFDVAISAIASQLYYNKVQNNISTSNDAYNYVVDINSHRNSFLIEPACTLRGGWNYLKFQLQMVLMTNTSNQELKFAHSNVTAGLYFSFANRYKTNNKLKNP